MFQIKLPNQKLFSNYNLPTKCSLILAKMSVVYSIHNVQP